MTTRAALARAYADMPATLWERRYGIPTRETGQRDHDADPARHCLARREAAAMRSRTFEAIRADALGDAGLAVDMEAAMQTFEPCPHCTGGGIGCCASVVESITR